MGKMVEIYTVLESSENMVPHSLESVIKHIEQYFDCLTTHQLLIGVIYTIMLECGYTLVSESNEDFTRRMEKNLVIEDEYNSQDDQTANNKSVDKLLLTPTFNYGQVISQTDFLPPNSLKPNNIYKFLFNLIGGPEYLFKLMLIPCGGGQAVINLIVTRDDCVVDYYSVAFQPNIYFRKSNDGHVASKFHDLKNFCIFFKDTIALKGRSLALNSLQIPNNSLEGLPEELLLKIMKFLPVKDVLNLSSTCAKFYSQCHECNLWNFLLKRDFLMKFDNLGVDKLISAYRMEKLKRYGFSSTN